MILGPIRFTVDCNPRDGKGSEYPRPSNVQGNQQSLGIWGIQSRGMGSKDWLVPLKPPTLAMLPSSFLELQSVGEGSWVLLISDRLVTASSARDSKPG